MGFRPSATLKSRTFVGLLASQFLAAFNDQAIHAAAMFFAFHMKLLNEKQAISLMPILFYAPWAIFCTLAGYCADRFSKRHSLVFWKFAEIAICLVALLGFYLGDAHDLKIGPAIVLACVFLMGTHSAFFVPAKYGVMPEILEPQLLSRGNGLLESLSFLAVILGTVSGGVMSYLFYDRETWIGVVLLSFAIVGALASLMIEVMPAANPTRPFPAYIYGPLLTSLRGLLGVRPLALAGFGIAFFTFVVAFMRQTVYMLGESQIPRWNELKTSLIVGSTALGIGLGSPLAGWLSGRKIELGLVPLGGIGMVIAAAGSVLFLHWVPGLVLGIVAIGFFTGFYLVPLYTLLQHRAPKQSKGDLVAISNFINVVGAILASILFFVLVTSFQKLGYAKELPFGEPVRGQLTRVKYAEGRLEDYTCQGAPQLPDAKRRVILAGEGLPPTVDPAAPVAVKECRCEYRGQTFVLLCPADHPDEKVYDNSGLPGFLFLGASAITGLSLLGLWAIMPDLMSRGIFAFRHLRGPRVRGVGTHHIPPAGPMVLVTNVSSREEFRYLRSATDRLLAPVGLPGENQTLSAALKTGRLVLLASQARDQVGQVPAGIPILPAFVGREGREVRVAFGKPVAPGDDIATLIEAARIAEDDYHAH
ncbi:MAG: MFS transporter [Gemmataceae bacterium]|nr:MFS transporter [Gemmataceae bacterium]